MKKVVAVCMMLVFFAGMMTACGKKEDTASVYYLNFKPEQDAQWQELAEIYTAETGVPVTVVTAASGDYETTLMAEMGKSDAPTMFQVNGPVGLKNWGDYCYDLTGTDVLKELTSDAYVLKAEDGSSAGVGYTIESYGIITNKGLLKKAGYKVEDINSLKALKKVAEDITARQKELGFAAFTSAGMDGSSDWRFKTHLANLPVYYELKKEGVTTAEKIKGTYLDQYRTLWDLYINNSTCSPKELSAKTADDARNEFLAEKAVFYQNGSWEYANLVGEGKFENKDLAILPIYFGVDEEEKQGLCTGTENYWCVNSRASEEDIHATLDFMKWCVTSETGTAALCGGEGAMPSGAPGMGFVIPFQQAKESDNVFAKLDAEMTKDGKEPVSWNFTTMPSDEWKNGVGSALTAYAADQTDENWKAVVSAFVDGWEKEYRLANG